mmetsp:Transcript_14441/g.18963  ORF Transcript_14441/g.18963 Transcript_14441/m.18963 type:complete len:255 (+) Transcript_14441:353-1117(+)
MSDFVTKRVISCGTIPTTDRECMTSGRPKIRHATSIAIIGNHGYDVCSMGFPFSSDIIQRGSASLQILKRFLHILFRVGLVTVGVHKAQSMDDTRLLESGICFRHSEVDERHHVVTGIPIDVAVLVHIGVSTFRSTSPNYHDINLGRFHLLQMSTICIVKNIQIFGNVFRAVLPQWFYFVEVILRVRFDDFRKNVIRRNVINLVSGIHRSIDLRMTRLFIPSHVNDIHSRIATDTKPIRVAIHSHSVSFLFGKG